MAPALVPSRPIKKLFLFWQAGSSPFPGSDTWELMEAMARSTEVIKSLGLLFRWQANVQEDIEQVFNSASEYHPYVEELIIWINFWKDNAPGLKRALNEILQVWSENCPTLEKVTFPNGTVWIKEPVVRRSAHWRQPPAFLRRAFLSDPRPPVDVIPQEIKNPLVQDYLFETGSVPYGVVSPEVGVSNTQSNSEIDSTPSPSSPHLVHHQTDSSNIQTATVYRWRRLNQPSANPDPHLFHTRIQGSELGWTEPTFKRDLKRDWPEELSLMNS
ncbi:hypothetical protein FS837_000223 [Tulasnella sp. UAMH 9824]|nr:hypothetical protein FS837_000223 [Tulasnella sp. UAMH 9824]